MQVALHFKTYMGTLVTSRNYVHDKTQRINSAKFSSCITSTNLQGIQKNKIFVTIKSNREERKKLLTTARNLCILHMPME
jgi:hypothetical protein